MLGAVKRLFSNKPQPDQFSSDAATLSTSIESITRNFTHQGLTSRYPNLYATFSSLVSKISDLRYCKPGERAGELSETRALLRALIDESQRVMEEESKAGSYKGVMEVYFGDSPDNIIGLTTQFLTLYEDSSSIDQTDFPLSPV